jgi:hypothetical protein
VAPHLRNQLGMIGSSAMLTITVAYVIDLSRVAIHRSLLGSKPGRTTEIDQLSDPSAAEISPRIVRKCLRDACRVG